MRIEDAIAEVLERKKMPQNSSKKSRHNNRNNWFQTVHCVQRFQCLECDYSATNQSNLNAHSKVLKNKR